MSWRSRWGPTKATSTRWSAAQYSAAAWQLTCKRLSAQFTRFYKFHLDHLALTNFSLLEIGVYKETSLRLWDIYFPCAEIVGADVQRYPSSRIITLDQSRRPDIERAAALRTWSVVIDDGSHKPAHQLETFMIFFPRLSSGGIYIIEDIETSFWARGRGRGYLYNWNMMDETELTDPVERFHRAALEVINGEYDCRRSSAVPVFSREVDKMIGTITFVRNAIVVTKIESGFFYRTSRRGRDVGTYWGRNHQDCNESRFHASLEHDSAEVVLAARRSKQGGRWRGRSEQS